jgi:site-specific DNA-methyltransferase (adenine-specific)
MDFDLSINRINNEPISRVYNCDNMIFMKEVPDKFFELAIVDPPYGIGYDGAKQTNGSHGGRKGHIFKGWDNIIPKKEYFSELYRISNNQIIWGANYFVEYLKPSMGWIIWRKDRGDFSSSDAELAYTSFKRALREYTKNPLILIQEGGTIHPTQKPLCLYKWLLNNYAKPGDKIFDSHLGSQSSRIASYHLGFDFWGCELDKDYYKDGCERFERECHEIYTLKNGTTIKQQNLF